MPKGKKLVQATHDAADLNKDVAIEDALLGDAGLVLDALVAEVRDRLKGKPRGRMTAVTQEIKNLKPEWLAQGGPRPHPGGAPPAPRHPARAPLPTVHSRPTHIQPD